MKISISNLKMFLIKFIIISFIDIYLIVSLNNDFVLRSFDMNLLVIMLVFLHVNYELYVLILPKIRLIVDYPSIKLFLT